MGRPPKSKIDVVEQKETVTPVVVQTAFVEPLISKQEIVKEKGCPFCVLNGSAHKLVMTGHAWQCLTCYKHWNESALGKPYSIELERGGEAYLRELEEKNK